MQRLPLINKFRRLRYGSFFHHRPGSYLFTPAEEKFEREWRKHLNALAEANRTRLQNSKLLENVLLKANKFIATHKYTLEIHPKRITQCEHTLAVYQSKLNIKLIKPWDKQILDLIRKRLQYFKKLNPPEGSGKTVTENMEAVLKLPKEMLLPILNALDFWLRKNKKDPDFKILQRDINLLFKNPKHALSTAKLVFYFFESCPGPQVWKLLRDNIHRVELIESRVTPLYKKKSKSLHKNVMTILSQINNARESKTILATTIFKPIAKESSSVHTAFGQSPIKEAKLITVIGDFLDGGNAKEKNRSRSYK